jgi:hypothetical protein
MKLFEGEAAKSAATSEVEKAKSAETTEPTVALRTPSSQTVVDQKVVEELTAKLETVKEKIAVVETKNLNPCDEDCKLAQQTYMRDNGTKEKKPVVAVAKKMEAKPVVKVVPVKVAPPKEAVKAAGVRDETVNALQAQATVFLPSNSMDAPTIRAIPYTENRSGITFPVCSDKPGGFSVCAEKGQPVTRIGISNVGPNTIVKKKNAENVYRNWGFSFPGLARQDLAISIDDSLSGTNSAMQSSVLMLFPRDTLPSIRTLGSKNIVTLPTGETVTFDAKTKEVVGGVFKERGPIDGEPASISYSGKGLMIRADSQGTDPKLGGAATVTKQGKSCMIPKEVFWKQSNESTGKFKFFSDKDLDSYLKRRCGFGIY